ncbi:hypothetical protein ILUMI_01278 [Ignelater luminosus]|uniref:cGMP-dependent protein kinase n=1 Tax=Ignelater luminosus TaxID=2038154 RepID=A0A8K0DKA8_IGNLU|nr:hypothetical protein ILUMI_01278 [Ignelater luminosus]
MFSCLCRKSGSFNLTQSNKSIKTEPPAVRKNRESVPIVKTTNGDAISEIAQTKVQNTAIVTHHVESKLPSPMEVDNEEKQEKVESTTVVTQHEPKPSSSVEVDNKEKQEKENAAIATQHEPIPPSSMEVDNEEKQEEDEEEEIANVKRRSGLAGHTRNAETRDVNSLEIVKHPKGQSDEALIKEALNKNDFLRNLLEGQRLKAVIDAMYSRDIRVGEVIIREGTVGTEMYISASGTYDITIKDTFINKFNDNRVFGELAILYDAKRQATIKALSSGKVWVLEQNVYQQLMLRSELEHHDQLLNFLRNVPKLNTVSDQALGRVTDLLKKEFFETGSIIVHQGDKGDKFYIISAGSVTITKDGEGEVGKMVRGEFFGQLALLKDDVRQATVTADAPGVECFSLSRPEFIEHFGNLEDIGYITTATPKSTSPIINPYEDIELLDLKIVDTLGVGGFGRVELVQHKKQKELTFALKYLKKLDMVQQQQQEHAYNEKNIQMNCDCIFIVRMYKTYRDNKYLFFLMESCLGGDLWSLLQKQKGRRFEEQTARFYAASVLEALAYLHERDIVYRDLKPENLLLDTRGYLKLTDFGFAKQLGSRGKAFTFAGTPEYVAPEIILNHGHDRAVDYWALGIFIFELLVGKTPFRSNDTSYLETYQLILRGIEQIAFPGAVPRRAENLVKKLCRSIATKRLGCLKSGAQDVRDHKWFLGFDWNQLRSGKLDAPIKRRVKSNTDTQFFDNYEKDTDIPPDELSGWDNDF